MDPENAWYGSGTGSYIVGPGSERLEFDPEAGEMVPRQADPDEEGEEDGRPRRIV